MDWVSIICALMGSITLTFLLEIIQNRRSTIMGKIEPPEITRREAFEDGFNLGELYVNKMKRMMQQSQTPRQTNCPNCGAPLENGKCSYCGTHVSHTVSTDDWAKYIKHYDKRREN